MIDQIMVTKPLKDCVKGLIEAAVANPNTATDPLLQTLNAMAHWVPVSEPRATLTPKQVKESARNVILGSSSLVEELLAGLLLTPLKYIQWSRALCSLLPEEPSPNLPNLTLVRLARCCLENINLAQADNETRERLAYYESKYDLLERRFAGDAPKPHDVAEVIKSSSVYR